MTSSRRSILKAGAAAAALTGIGAPHVARAQQKPPRQVRMVPHGDLNVLDPIWTTQNMAAYHGAMMYDTLFGIVDTHVWGTVLIWIAAVLTVWSMVYYLRKALPEIRARVD